MSDPSSTFTLAAMDTTSRALPRILHILSTRLGVQSKLRWEIVDARSHHHGNLEYDELGASCFAISRCSLPWILETVSVGSFTSMHCWQIHLAVIRPVRLWWGRTLIRSPCWLLYYLGNWSSAIGNSTRQDVVLPLSMPIKGLDGQEITEVPIPNNTNVIVGILAANRNPEIWGPDSYEWKPERWLSPLPDSVAAAHIPGVYSNLWVQLIPSKTCHVGSHKRILRMTFLGGGRACMSV